MKRIFFFNVVFRENKLCHMLSFPKRHGARWRFHIHSERNMKPFHFVNFCDLDLCARNEKESNEIAWFSYSLKSELRGCFLVGLYCAAFTIVCVISFFLLCSLRVSLSGKCLSAYSFSMCDNGSNAIQP